MKRAKKITSIILAIILCLSTVSVAFPALAISNAYIDADGIYHRDVNGTEETFNTSFNTLVEGVYQDIFAHKDSITMHFACPEDSKYFFDLATSDTSSQEYITAKTKAMKLCTDAFFEALKVHREDPLSGDYMYYNIILSDLPTFYEGDIRKNFDFTISPIKNDIDSQSKINGIKYCQMSVTINNIHYYADDTVSQKVRDALKKFKDYYITNNMTDYEKVKTIYDFVVRNTKYDTQTSQTHPNQIGTDDTKYVSVERYIRSHSVYGALFGNSSPEKYNWNKGNTVTTDNVLEQADQGLAVCEGYSKLFYALCITCGVDCHIIDGDYHANEEDYQVKDPHQWNEVCLKDETGENNWYLIDTTFASQFSIKQIDFNSYRFFLRGRDFFENGNHQLPYKCESYDPDTNEKYVNDYNFQHETDGNYQYPLYDYYDEATYEPSTIDYSYPNAVFKNETDGEETPFLICRSYTIEKDGKTEERGAYLLTNDKEKRMIEFSRDEDNKIIAETVKEGQEGFLYNGQTTNTFEISIPYVVKGTKYIDEKESQQYINVSSYNIDVTGKNDTKAKVNFNIVPLDMSYDEDNPNNQESHYDSKTSKIQREANFTGSDIKPNAFILDGFGNQLNKDSDKDFEIKVYADANRTQPTTINDIGTYYISIVYKGNYHGEYKFHFTVNKMDLSEMKFAGEPLQYYPEGFRKNLVVGNSSTPITTPTAYANAFCSTLKYADGTKVLELENHYTITATGNLDYNGTIEATFTAKQGNGIVAEGTQKTVQYKIAKQFDLNDAKVRTQDETGAIIETTLNGFWAELPSKTYSYTGKAIEPKSFGFLDSLLKQGVDYEIVGYENNIEPSTSSNNTAFVIIKGINGCTGTIKLKFAIIDNRKFIAQGPYKYVNNVFTYSIVSDGKTLTKGVDYKEDFCTKEIENNGKLETLPCLTITGIGDYRGTVEFVGITYENVYPCANGHKNVSLNNAVAATCTKAGKKTDTKCSVCGLVTKGATISAKGHKYVKTKTVAPTYAAKGYTLYTCSTCKATKKTDYKNALTVAKPTISKITSPKAKQLKITWGKKSYTGYQVEVATDSKFTKNKKSATITSAKTVTKTITSLKAKTKYYVRVRAYKTYNGKKYYSSWSTVKTYKTK